MGVNFFWRFLEIYDILIKNKRKVNKYMKQKNDEEHFEEEFIKLVSENKLSINSIEELMLEEIKRYKNKLEMQLEELLKSQINEKELITKKNKNGKKKDMN